MKYKRNWPCSQCGEQLIYDTQTETRICLCGLIKQKIASLQLFACFTIYQDLETETLKSMPIFTHKLRIQIGLCRILTIYQDFNTRFTQDYLLINNFVTVKGYYTQWWP